MGCDTVGLIKGHIRIEDIFAYIKRKYDRHAEFEFDTREGNSIEETIESINRGRQISEGICAVQPSCQNDTIYKRDSGEIYFKYRPKNGTGNVEERRLFYYYSNINFMENLEYYSDRGLKNMVLSETTSISFGSWGHSEEIVTDIVRHFGGGWVDVNDCDEIPYAPVLGEKQYNTKDVDVKHITLKELYETFGGVVVIDDYNM